MECGARAEVNVGSEGVLEQELDVGQLNQANRFVRIAIDEDVDVGVWRCFVASGRSEEIERRSTHSAERLLGAANEDDGVFTIHTDIICRIRTKCNDCLYSAPPIRRGRLDVPLSVHLWI